MSDKDIKEYHKMIKKLEEQNRFQKEQDELKESYKQSKLNKERKKQPVYVKPPEASVVVPNFNPTSQFSDRYSSRRRRNMLSSLDNLQA